MKTAWISGLAIALALLGCATPPRPVPMSLMDVISMAKAGATDDEIIARIQQSQTIFVLNANQVVTLRQEGVSEPVVNYLLDTHRRAVAEAARRQAESNISWGFSYGYGWGYPRWCW